MKWFTTIAMVSLISTLASAKIRTEGKCAKASADAVMMAYNGLSEGNYLIVVSSTVTKNPSVYKVLAVGMDGSSEPFRISHDVTLNPKTCLNASVSNSH